jgi:ATP-dependent Lon protease
MKEKKEEDKSTKKRKKPSILDGEIELISYKPFCPYRVDLEDYKTARSNFSIDEWIDVLISAVDYNPHGYTDEITGEESPRQKLFFLRRLLPFVEKRINLIELAPKGTGKSYVYEKITKRGWLVSSGSISRASLFYDNAKHIGGLITRFDYVGFDETQSIQFIPEKEIQTGLKTYMEFGEVKGFDAQMPADAGIVVLGNVDASFFNLNANLVKELNPIFRESALLDRFHGLIPGWEIPRFKNDMIANGWALNTEYFAEVLHQLREDRLFTAVVDSCLDIPSKADQRDLTAIKRLCTAFLKLLFPHVKSKNDISPDDFEKYCLEPAKEMRESIRRQLNVVDPKEFPQIEVPDIQFKL